MHGTPVKSCKTTRAGLKATSGRSADGARQPASARAGCSVPASPSQVRLEIFDVTGRRVRTVLDGPMTRGGHIVAWDSRNSHGQRVGSGVYWARLIVNGRNFGTKKMVVIR